jgi:hypothetical protein
VFANPIFRSKMNQQLTPALSVRAILDYAAVRPNTRLSALDMESRFTADVLLTYLVNPGTALYAGYTDRFDNFDTAPISNGRQLFVKVGYLLRP